jgi:EpsI family protein
MNTTTAAGNGERAANAPAQSTTIRVVVLVALMGLAALAGELMRPTDRLADRKAKIVLEKQVPEAFGEWRLDTNIRPVLPDPGLQAMLDVLYSQTLARTYVNAKGERVMLSIAYGSDQSNEATAVHRPEFCYSAQGFRVKPVDKQKLNVGGIEIPVARLLAQLGQRNEPITYWVTLDESATLPGLGRKLQQIRYGLKGQIPDGMLVRLSSLSASQTEAFALQTAFLDQLYAAVPANVRGRYFGVAEAS